MLDLQSVYFGQKHKDFSYEDYDLIRKIARLAGKHQSQAVNDCNGEGYVDSQVYYCGSIDDYAKRKYGQNVKSAYLTKDGKVTIFNQEAGRIEDKIKELLKTRILCDVVNNYGRFKVEFQGDPRGATVKLTYEGEYIEL